MEGEKQDISTPGMDAVAPEAATRYPIKQHWKCLAACTLMSLCPFQYGFDFGLIGGLQAMVGFLRVRCSHLFGVYHAAELYPHIRSSATKMSTSREGGTSRRSDSSSSPRS